MVPKHRLQTVSQQSCAQFPGHSDPCREQSGTEAAVVIAEPSWTPVGVCAPGIMLVEPSTNPAITLKISINRKSAAPQRKDWSLESACTRVCPDM